jgi:hypothetical protein
VFPVEAQMTAFVPRSMAFDWTELAYMQLQAGNTALYVFALAVVFVFLVLAAQYESFRLPLAIILIVPMCLLFAITGVWLKGSDNNIFTQIGLIVLVGLACKNAILIVEFAKARVSAGEDIRTATLDACRLRLRPILMTSFAFILGVVPLVLAEGAGAEMRRALGTAVFSGMIGVTLFGIFLTPVFFSVIEHVSLWKVFSTGWLPRIGAESLKILRLEPLRRGIAATSRRIIAVAKPRTKQQVARPVPPQPQEERPAEPLAVEAKPAEPSPAAPIPAAPAEIAPPKPASPLATTQEVVLPSSAGVEVDQPIIVSAPDVGPALPQQNTPSTAE